MSETDDSADETVEAESVKEYIKRSRLEAIFDAREEAAEALRDARLREGELSTSRSTEAAERIVTEHVRASAVSYILECEALFTDTGTGLEYWQDQALGEIDLPETPGDDHDWLDVTARRVVDVPEGLVDDDAGVVRVPSVRQFVRLPSDILVEFKGEARVGGLGRGTDTVQSTAVVPVPRDVSRRAFRATNHMLADLDVGLEVADDAHAELTVDDL